jgi:hypothetical protein
MALGLAVATMVAVIPVATRAQIPPAASQGDQSPIPDNVFKLEN